jgi:hypothetical protein
MVKAEGSDRDLKQSPYVCPGACPDVGGYEKCSFYARPRLIESIINECMVAPNIHKRVLWNEDIRSAHQCIKGKNRERDAPL